LKRNATKVNALCFLSTPKNGRIKFLIIRDYLAKKEQRHEKTSVSFHCYVSCACRLRRACNDSRAATSTGNTRAANGCPNEHCCARADGCPDEAACADSGARSFGE